MTKAIKLKYGRKHIYFSSGAGKFLGFISPDILSKIMNERKIIQDALDKPINSPSLEKFIDLNDKILIIIPDKTRLCRIKLILPIVLKKLAELGIKREQIKIIFANGSHSLQTEKEKIDIIGESIYKNYNILEHNAFDSNQSCFYGKTKYGTEIELNKVIKESDKIISIGTVVHHYFAGFGGGAKMIMPGLAYYSTIEQNHKRTIKKNGTINPGCKSANFRNNPVYKDVIDSIRFYPPIFSISNVLNEKGRIVNCLSGNLLSVHNELIKIINKYYLIKIKEKADLVIVSAGGYPKDINFIQSHKAIQNAYYTIQKGGIIICLAECKEGIGSKTFLDWFKFSDETEFKRKLLTNYSLNAQTALSLKNKLKNSKIILISKLKKNIVIKMGIIPAKNIKDAIFIANKFLKNNYRYYIIKNGSLVVPSINQ